MGATGSKHRVSIPRINFLEGYEPIETFGRCGCGVEAILGDGLCVVCWDALCSRKLPFAKVRAKSQEAICRSSGTTKGMEAYHEDKRTTGYKIQGGVRVKAYG